MGFTVLMMALATVFLVGPVLAADRAMTSGTLGLVTSMVHSEVSPVISAMDPFLLLLQPHIFEIFQDTLDGNTAGLAIGSLFATILMALIFAVYVQFWCAATGVTYAAIVKFRRPNIIWL